MTNFDIFNKESLRQLIEPFAVGMTEHITPIKYEAITPDIFAFSFRTTGNNAEGDPKDHYFVSLQFDYMESLVAARDLIVEWHGSEVIEFWNPEGSSEDEDPRVDIDKTYQALLAKVERPSGEGYWAKNHVVLKIEDVDEFVMSLDEKVREGARKSLNEIFTNHPGVGVSVYVRPDGEVEFFFG